MRSPSAVTPSPPHPFTPSSCEHRRGTTLLELMIAGLLLGTLIAVVVPTLGWVVGERRSTEQRQLALFEVANVLERLTAEDWDELTAEKAEQMALSPEVTRQLPGAAVKVNIVAEPDEPAAKRITAALSWSDRSGQTLAPVQLTAWVYRRGRAE